MLYLGLLYHISAITKYLTAIKDKSVVQFLWAKIIIKHHFTSDLSACIAGESKGYSVEIVIEKEQDQQVILVSNLQSTWYTTLFDSSLADMAEAFDRFTRLLEKI